MKITAIAVVFIASLLVAPVGTAEEIHVAPDGNDDNPGAQSTPLATLTAARDMLRHSGWLGRKPCTVVIHGGIYRLTEPLTFVPQDGGSAEFPVVYRAAGDGAVILTGAQALKAEWIAWKDGIYRAKLGDIPAIDQLIADGRRQHMARYPNFGSGFETGRSQRGTKAGIPPYGGSSSDAWDVSRATRWKDPTGAFMHGMHSGLWGGMHFRVLGKHPDGSLQTEGGWQNNRRSAPHAAYRMIENVIEELDAPGEWFHDTKEGWIYYMPEPGRSITTMRFEIVQQLKHLMQFYGDMKQPMATLAIDRSGNGIPNQSVAIPETSVPVRHIQVRGIQFKGTRRTFMETAEPILRSDWCLYRGGAVHLRGAEDIVIEHCDFEELGGNAVFIDGYNRRIAIRGNLFRSNGASDVNLVGSPGAVRTPIFAHGAGVELDSLDTTPGPKNSEYPADCLVEDNFMTLCGRFEKQTSGINLSMASRISVRHNTISHTPRAAINICDGTWGGHVIEWNDCFETVLETHDHGAFNSWGRDRFWLRAGLAGPVEKDGNGTPLISKWLAKHPDMPRWDAYQTTILRHNRMHCDHGWDIDLDDGSSNYEIYNNVCLSGGLKTREGYYRMVTNNIIFRSYTCNVPYPKPTHDFFLGNIIWGIGYSASNPKLWGGIRNKTFLHVPGALETSPAAFLQITTEDDADSLMGDAKFLDPLKGDFRVANDSPALGIGFRNFSMMGFGVISPRLKAMASSPPIRLPTTKRPGTETAGKILTYDGAEFRDLATDADLTATGMFEKTGALLVSVANGSRMAGYGFETDDVVLTIDHTKVDSSRRLRRLLEALKPGPHAARVWRGQKAILLKFDTTGEPMIPPKS